MVLQLPDFNQIDAFLGEILCTLLGAGVTAQVGDQIRIAANIITQFLIMWFTTKQWNTKLLLNPKKEEIKEEQLPDWVETWLNEELRGYLIDERKAWIEEDLPQALAIKTIYFLINAKWGMVRAEVQKRLSRIQIR